MRITLNPGKPETRTWSVQTCLEGALTPTFARVEPCRRVEAFNLVALVISKNKAEKLMSEINTCPQELCSQTWFNKSLKSSPSSGRWVAASTRSLSASVSWLEREGGIHHSESKQTPSGSFGGNCQSRTNLFNLTET